MSLAHVPRTKGVWRRRWTREEFYRLLDLGFFNGQRVELLEGEIIQTASQKNYHAIGISLTENELRAVFGPNYWIRVQMTLDLIGFSALDPDLAVVSGAPRTHDPQHNPTAALLLVEVSETTLKYDRGRTASVYAAASIQDYWVLNLVDRQLEIYRHHVADPKNKHTGFKDADVTILQAGDYATPLAAPQARVAVADLLP